MSNSKDEQKRDDVLKRMLETPPQPHKPPKAKKKAKRRKAHAKAAESVTKLPPD